MDVKGFIRVRSREQLNFHILRQEKPLFPFYFFTPSFTPNKKGANLIG